MKNVIIISMLLFFQCACTTQNSQPAEARSLLSFVDLADEISVEHEIIESTAALDVDGPDSSSD